MLDEGRCERTFITFSDEETMKQAFPNCGRPKTPEKVLCPITRLVCLEKYSRVELKTLNTKKFKHLKTFKFLELYVYISMK